MVMSHPHSLKGRLHQTQPGCMTLHVYGVTPRSSSLAFVRCSSPGRGVMQDCEIRGNALAGVLMSGLRTNPHIQGCRIVRGRGAGIVVEEEAGPVIRDCVFDMNMCPSLLVEKKGNPTVCSALHSSHIASSPPLQPLQPRATLTNPLQASAALFNPS